MATGRCDTCHKDAHVEPVNDGEGLPISEWICDRCYSEECKAATTTREWLALAAACGCNGKIHVGHGARFVADQTRRLKALEARCGQA
jgi:hypothetical protein